MGMLVDGLWTNQWYDTKSTGGRFKRSEARFRNFVTKDGSPGPTGEGDFAAEANRYHLYVSLACPWAHRTLIFRNLKQLQNLISVSIVDAKMPDQHGWTIPKGEDPVNHAKTMWQVYVAADKDYTGRVTVPVLWDKKQNTIVSNESSEIIRMFNTEFDHLTGNDLDFYPHALRNKIDPINERIYGSINNGVYKTGFATTQEAYDEAVTDLFESLDWVEDILSNNKYLAGDTLTEADWRLFTTLVRFDPVYVGHFKCNIRRIADYPNISRLVDELRAIPGVEETIDMEHIKVHYYWSHTSINPHRIVPAGPAL
ncbi:glutathione S-transferase family protein [Maritalea porphyrae]|uniref:Glutathione-dependent reductase n=1 Tax=Maritalea porphyrae TaxID=880732 RepID=A0ABQ5UMX2_9HYPH|nr:glutathione S-transferase family protein [Maritalea porphyrae]GLQ15764.1 glutathione-dependent reductase [Maritalea porphyrae]